MASAEPIPRETPVTTPRVSVVCLSFNRPALLADALAAIAAQTYSNIDVTIVDNRSARSAEVASVAGRYPQFRFIAHPVNSGFAAGMNIGMRQSTGEFVCLTEDDLVLAPDFIERLVAHCAEAPDAGLIAGLLINRESNTILCAGGDYDLGAVFRFRFRGEGVADVGQYHEPFASRFISGSMIFGRRDVLWDLLHGFREDFFLYFEDLELCHRAALAGRTVVVVPTARAYHAEPPTAARAVSSLVEYHKWKNLCAVYLLYARGPVIPAFVARHMLWPALKDLLALRFAAARPRLGALNHVLLQLPRLLRDRRRVVPTGVN